MESSIEQAWQAGRAAWPDVLLELAPFTAHLEQVDPGRSSRYPTDIYLAAACLARDTAAIAAFDREIITSARGAIGGIDSNPTFIDEALQRLRANLLVGDAGTPRLVQYAGRGPLRAWVGIAAARTALMMRRSAKRAKEVVAAEEPNWTNALALISTNNPELELLKRQYASAFTSALHDAVEELDPRLRSALKMSFVEDLSIDEIGAVYAVHRGTAARWIQRACDTLFARTRELLTERLALTPTELDRMTALVHSQLEVSLSQLLPSEF